MAIKFKQVERFKRIKNAYKYFEYFYNADGQSEVAGYLPFLVIWFRESFSKAGINDVKVCEYCGFTKDEEEDFLSWGHNSRYNHTFTTWCLMNKDKVVELILDLFGRNEGFDPEINIEEKK